MANCNIESRRNFENPGAEQEKFKTGNIYLIGGRWGGKTTIGKPLAEGLKKSFVDMDDLAEQRIGMSIDSFVKMSNGEWGPFRTIETDILRQMSTLQNTVFATGGGIIERPENIEIMRKTGIIIYLKASADTLRKRALLEIRDNKSRRSKPPLLPGFKSAVDEIPTVLNLRGPIYDRIADITVNTDFLSEQTDIQRIIAELDAIA